MRSSPATLVENLYIEVEDNNAANIGAHFDTAIAFISGCLESGGTVLVHCFAGVSRSASCVIAYLMVCK